MSFEHYRALVVLCLMTSLAGPAASEPGGRPQTCEAPSEAPSRVGRQEVDILLDRARLAVRTSANEAAPLLDHAGERVRSLPPGPARIRSRVHLGRTLSIRARKLKESGMDRPGAIRSIELAAVEELRAAASEARAAGLHRWESWADGYRAELYERSSRVREALVLNEDALLAAGALNDPELLALWYAQRARLYEARGNFDASLSAYRLARNELSRLRPSMPTTTFFEIAEPILLPLTDLLLRTSGATGTPVDREQQLLLEAQEALEDFKTAELRDYFGDACLASQQERGSYSIPGATVLYPVLLEDRVEIMVGRNGRLHRVVSSTAPAEVHSEIERMRLHLQDATTHRYREPARKLYRSLIQPIENFLDAETDTLVIVASGQLQGIPFSALLDERSGEFLIQRVAIAVTPSLRLTEPRPLDRHHAEALIAGLTTQVEGFQALPAVGDEMSAVQEWFPGSRLSGEAFSTAGFRAAFDSRPFGIVHIASHGVFTEDPENSFIVTADGRLSVEALADILGKCSLPQRTPTPAPHPERMLHRRGRRALGSRTRRPRHSRGCSQHPGVALADQRRNHRSTHRAFLPGALHTGCFPSPRPSAGADQPPRRRALATPLLLGALRDDQQLALVETDFETPTEDPTRRRAVPTDDLRKKGDALPDTALPDSPPRDVSTSSDSHPDSDLHPRPACGPDPAHPARRPPGPRLAGFEAPDPRHARRSQAVRPRRRAS